MIWANQRLVISMARKFIGRGMDMPDLIAEGMTGLAKGVDRFDHTKGFKFSTYAHWWIRQAISRSLSEQGRMIRWDFMRAWGVPTAAVQASAAARAHEKRQPAMCSWSRACAESWVFAGHKIPGAVAAGKCDHLGIDSARCGRGADVTPLWH